MDPYIKEWPNQVAEDFCQHLIRRFDADSRVRPDPQPDYSQRQFLLISGLTGWVEECRRLDRLVFECARRYFRVPAAYRTAGVADFANDGYLLARYRPGDVCVLHVDGQCPVPPQNNLRLATFLLFLNDPQQGGETVFPLQQVKVRPEVGKVIMFPPGHTHPHEVLPPLAPRYILQTWITDPKLIVTRASGRKSSRL